MKKIIFDANFQNNSFIEQMQAALFKACLKVSNEYIFSGVCNEPVIEEFSDNVNIHRIVMGKFNNLWQNTIIPMFAFCNKEIPLYFPCGNIPGLLPENTPVVSFLKDVLPLETPKYFASEGEEKLYKRQIQTDINRSDLLFVPSAHVKEILQKEFLLLNEPVVLKYASLIPDEYIDLPLARNQEKYFFVETDNISHSGLNDILKNFIYLHTTKKDCVRLYLAGGLKTTNQELAINLQVARKVGAIREYHNLSAGQRASMLRGAIAALLPAKTDILPISHLDAMKCSCPIITDSTPAITDVCQDAVIYADIRNTSNYNNILNYLQENDNVRNEYIAKGKEREKSFYWNNSAQIFLERIEII